MYMTESAFSPSSSSMKDQIICIWILLFLQFQLFQCDDRTYSCLYKTIIDWSTVYIHCFGDRFLECCHQKWFQTKLLTRMLWIYSISNGIHHPTNWAGAGRYTTILQCIFYCITPFLAMHAIIVCRRLGSYIWDDIHVSAE